jgi:HK97 family phage major capsid protein
MKTKLQELLVQRAEKDNQVKALFDAADTRGANTKEEITQIKSLNKEIGDLNTEISELEETQAIKRGTEERLKAYNEPNPKAPHPQGDGASAQPFKSVGDMVLGDPDMVEFLKSFQGGRSTNGRKIESPAVNVKTLITGTSATSAGAMVNQDRKPLVDMYYARPLTVVDLITVGETTSDLVEYVRVTGVTNNAATVAEATATGDGTGAKPESAMLMALVQAAVKTLAHWVPASTRALADAAQLRTLIDGFLRYGLDEELEDQILTGDASGENFDGILHVSGTTAQAYDTDLLKTTRKARTKVRVTGRARPTAWVMHPNDWETFDLTEDNEARYYFGGPRELGNPRLWGLPVVESEGMTEGTAVVADWKLAVLWQRMQTMISMSNSHSDFFVRNLVAILAEMRAAFGVIRPAAFVLADLTA